jgi:hypothetical protein
VYVIGFKLASFGKSIPFNRRALALLLEALTEINVSIFRTYGDTVPGLYESGIKYRRESIGQEDWCDVVELLRLGFGDCEDLSCYRAAELRVRHGDANARPFVKGPRKLPGGVMMYHIQVQHGDGRIEDPSLVLGMGSARDRTPATYRIRHHEEAPLQHRVPTRAPSQLFPAPKGEGSEQPRIQLASGLATPDNPYMKLLVG